MMTSMIISLVPLVVMAAAYVWFGLTMGKLFAQLGVESWKAWVPIINQLEMLKLVDRPSSQIIIIMFIPLYGLYVYYQVLQDMTRLCGGDEKLALLALILPPIWASKMMDDGVSPHRPKATEAAQAQLGLGAPQPMGGSMFGPPVQSSAAAVGAPAYGSGGYSQQASGFGDPFAQAAQPQAWPGADPTAPSPAWSAAPVLPVQDADPFHAARVQAQVAPGGQPVQPPQMLAQPTPSPVQAVQLPVAAPAPAQPAQYLVAAPVPVQPSAQAPVMTPPVMLSAAPSAPAQPGPAQTMAPVAPVLASASSPQPAMTPPVMLSAAPSATAQPSPPPRPSPPPLAPPVPAEAPVECTVLIDRAASQPWSLLLDDGRRFDLWAPSVLIGRAPSAAGPGTQVLAISDETCTISKVHARLDLVGGAWQVTDAGSTNGIIVTRAGRAYTVPSGTSATVDEQLVLGSVGMRLAAGGQPQQARA